MHGVLSSAIWLTYVLIMTVSTGQISGWKTTMLGGMVKRKKRSGDEAAVLHKQRFPMMIGSGSWSDKENELYKGVFLAGF